MRRWFCALFALSLTMGAAKAQTLEDAVLERINFARQHPQLYAQRLRDYRLQFDGYVVHAPGDPVGTETFEGVSAVDEAIAFLEHQVPLAPLGRGEVLGRAAGDYAQDQGNRGARGHVGWDGTSPGERVRRHGGGIHVGEGIAYGYADPDAVVRQLIVDDGVSNRGHRALLFDPGFRFAGVGCARHRALAHICVVDIASTADGRWESPRFADRR
ncbi:CAP domain-containing protein [Sphingomonas sp. TDK1]|uniref:CAP domain-containing protein n=1 Tax=Sphingomonas sp. TDK1 TaxID=453247 RepID=UPI0007DA2CBB|nr:CAP domain-containing protein [Sphingomonas sp. TDK1]OAN57061.1 hypothetical protein A7X12_07395 [Sphingomonas sp. TDK1]